MNIFNYWEIFIESTPSSSTIFEVSSESEAGKVILGQSTQFGFLPPPDRSTNHFHLVDTAFELHCPRGN